MFSKFLQWFFPASNKPANQRLKRINLIKQLHECFKGDKLYEFHGGEHVDCGKELSNQAEIKILKDLPFYLLNLQQHKGPHPIPVVKIGQEVKAGEPLTSQFLKGELPIHAPVAGEILDIMEYLAADSIKKTGPTAVLRPFNLPRDNAAVPHPQLEKVEDFKAGTPIGPAFYPALDYRQAKTLDLLYRIKYAGIAGLGGAVFPSARKINARKFTTLLINAVECEPYITCDQLLMEKYPEQVVESWLCIQHILQAETVVVAIEDNKLEAVKALEQYVAQALTQVQTEISQFEDQLEAQLAAKFDSQVESNSEVHSESNSESVSESTPESNSKSKPTSHPNLESLTQRLQGLKAIKIRVIPTIYPSGNQRTTVEILTGMRLTKNQNLTSFGAICFNVATVYAMYRSIAYGEVMTQRLVTITGKGIKNPGNY